MTVSEQKCTFLPSEDFIKIDILFFFFKITMTAAKGGKVT
jgi:hypothetical protein